jgi:ketosteroid isomerase-like protein
MSQADVALVQGLYATFGRGDIATIVTAAASDIEWRLNGSRSDYPLLGTWNGPKGVQAFFDELAKLQDFSEFTPREFLAAGDRVFVLGHMPRPCARTAARRLPTGCTFSQYATARSPRSSSSPTRQSSRERGRGDDQAGPVTTGRSGRAPHSDHEPS